MKSLGQGGICLIAFVLFVIAGTMLPWTFGWAIGGNPVWIGFWVLLFVAAFVVGRLRKRNL